jgi:hypothetical protein
MELAKPKQKADNPYSNINEDNCEFHYNLCMNKVCTDIKIGKCVCYEDMYRNTNSTEFATVGGNKVRKGFDLLSSAQRSCQYVVDNCMEGRRIVTEKYRTMVQRDCLKLAEIEAMKDRGLYGELQDLKACARDYCTASSGGVEDFSFPELGLCFDRLYANFVVDAHCSNIIAKSKTPAALKRLFFSNMGVLREQSCARMNGHLSDDRSMCYLTVEYGPSKDMITKTKRMPVGDVMTCNAAYFDTKLGLTYAAHRAKFTQAVSVASAAIRIGGSIAGMAMGSGPIGGLIGGGLDIAAAGVDMAITHHQVEMGEISDAQATAYSQSAGLDMVMGAVSVAAAAAQAAVQGLGAATTAAKASGDVAATAAKVAEKTGQTVEAATKTIQTSQQVVKTAQVVSTAMSITAQAVSLGASITDVAIEADIEKQRREEEVQDIIKMTTIQDREAGVGFIGDASTGQQSTGVRGACFINKEWFATENEMLLLQWTL